MRFSIALLSVLLFAMPAVQASAAAAAATATATAATATAAATGTAPAAVSVTPPVSKTVSLVELDTVTVMALSQADKRAVLALPDKQMVVVKTGDPVPRTRAVLAQVMADKVVLEENSADGKTRQQVWMHKGQGATPGRLERFSTEAAPSLVTPAPMRTTVQIKAPAPGAKSTAQKQP